jgi:hypothetical protein
MQRLLLANPKRVLFLDSLYCGFFSHSIVVLFIFGFCFHALFVLALYCCHALLLSCFACSCTLLLLCLTCFRTLLLSCLGGCLTLLLSYFACYHTLFHTLLLCLPISHLALMPYYFLLSCLVSLFVCA